MDKIIELINTENDPIILKEKLNTYHPYDIGQAFLLLDDEKRKLVYEIFDTKEMAEIISYIDTECDFLEDLNASDVANIISEMEPDDAKDIISDISDKAKDEILSYLDEETREDILELTSYEDYQAGSIMINNYLSIDSSTSVNHAMKEVIKRAPFVEDIDTIFVTNNNILVGIVSLKELICAKSPLTLNDIMDENFIYVDAFSDIIDAINLVKDYDIYSLPVLENKSLVGIITMDDAMSKLVDESIDNYAKLSGLTSDLGANSNILESLKKRIPWLAVLLVLNFFVSIVSSSFEGIINEKNVLVLFQSVILGLAGNAGTQSLAVTIRKISQSEFDTKRKTIKHLLIELKTGIFLGLILGILALGFVSFILFVRNDRDCLKIGIIVGLAILLSMSLSSLIGGLIPIIFDKLKIDPAIASGPFITTINDVMAIIIYFSIASIMLLTQFI